MFVCSLLRDSPKSRGGPALGHCSQLFWTSLLPSTASISIGWW